MHCGQVLAPSNIAPHTALMPSRWLGGRKAASPRRPGRHAPADALRRRFPVPLEAWGQVAGPYPTRIAVRRVLGLFLAVALEVQ